MLFDCSTCAKMRFHVNTLHYAGHVPDNVTNEVGLAIAPRVNSLGCHL